MVVYTAGLQRNLYLIVETYPCRIYGRPVRSLCRRSLSEAQTEIESVGVGGQVWGLIGLLGCSLGFMV